MNFWSWYTSTIKNTVLNRQTTDDDLWYYKDQLFYYIIAYTLIFSPLAIIPGLIASIINDKTEIFVLNIAAFLVLIILGFQRNISLETRKTLFLSLLLIVSWTLLFSLGLEGPGEIYLFTVTILACFIKSIKDAYNTVLANSVLLIFSALNIHFGWLPLLLSDAYNLSEWIGTTVNIIFLSIILVACFNIIFQKLEAIIKKQKVLNDKVKSDNVQMKHVQHLLQDKNQALNQFAHTVSHDLKEPLRSMQAFAQLTVSKYQESLPSEGQEYLKHIQTSSERMAMLLDSLLEYSQIGTEMQSSTFSVQDLVKELEKDLSQLIQESKAEIKYHDLPQITGYELEFKQLLQNLFANAIKFKRDNELPKLTIRSIESDDFWKFVVKDNGIGIEPKYTEKIFAIFHRLDKRKYPGTGLGLANCKKIVEMHRGEIWVESIPEVESEFHFTISKDL